VDVIQSIPGRRAYSYVDSVDGRGKNVIHKWLDDNEVSGADRSALQNLIDIYENNGLHAVVTCVIDLENGFYGLLTKRKGGVYPCPIFCLGPFAENEITLLAGASWDMKKKRLKPLYADGIAQENLEALLERRGSRRHEPITD
jgi:hypothetical protein